MTWRKARLIWSDFGPTQAFAIAMSARFGSHRRQVPASRLTLIGIGLTRACSQLLELATASKCCLPHSTTEQGQKGRTTHGRACNDDG